MNKPTVWIQITTGFNGRAISGSYVVEDGMAKVKTPRGERATQVDQVEGSNPIWVSSGRKGTARFRPGRTADDTLLTTVISLPSRSFSFKGAAFSKSSKSRTMQATRGCALVALLGVMLWLVCMARTNGARTRPCRGDYQAKQAIARYTGQSRLILI